MLRVAVERQRDAVVLRQLQQPRQDVVVAVGADDDVGVVLLEQVADAQHQLAAAAAREAQRLALDLDQQVAAVAAAGIAHVAVQAQRHRAQLRQAVVDLLGRVERFDACGCAAFHIDGAVGQREDAARQARSAAASGMSAL